MCLSEEIFASSQSWVEFLVQLPFANIQSQDGKFKSHLREMHLIQNSIHCDGYESDS